MMSSSSSRWLWCVLLCWQVVVLTTAWRPPQHLTTTGTGTGTGTGIRGSTRPVHSRFASSVTASFASSIATASTSTAASSSKTGMTSLTADGGVKKSLIKAGKGKKAESGDILAVKYTLRLPFSPSSPTNPQPAERGTAVLTDKIIAKGDKVKFTFQDGTMIKGWDIALESMKVGEHAVFEITSTYGYGTKGLGNNAEIIPSQANLVLDVEILAWLGNELQPETLFQKDLDIDPFLANTPEMIQQEFEERQVSLMILFHL